MQWLSTVRNGGKLYWKAKSTTDCSAREEEEGNTRVLNMADLRNMNLVQGMISTFTETLKK
jgi:hypothetical protein